MRQRLDSLSALASDYGITVMVIHHHNKSPHEGLNKSRGATSITDWASAILTLTSRRPKGEERKHLIRGEWTKVRSFVRPEPVTLEMLDGGTFRAVDSRIADICPEDVVTVIQEAGGSFVGRGPLVEAIRGRFEVGRDRADKVLTEATRTEAVVSERDPENRSRVIFRLPEEECILSEEAIGELL
jgi:hypothetical protein